MYGKLSRIEQVISWGTQANSNVSSYQNAVKNAVLKIASNTKFNEKLEYLNDEWREKRNQLTHSLFNKDPDTVITEVKIMAKNGYEAVRIFDQAVSQLKKEKIRDQFKIK